MKFGIFLTIFAILKPRDSMINMSDIMIKKWKKKKRKKKYYREMNSGLFFLGNLDLATKDMPKYKQKQIWRALESPVSRPRVLRELFEALNK